VRQKKIGLFFIAASLFFFLLLFTSCSLVFSPVQYDVIQGKHCVVPITCTDITTEVYKTMCILGDRAYESVIRLTDLVFTQYISIVYDPEFDTLHSHGIASAANFVVMYGDNFLTLSTDQKEIVLRHEITHIITSAYFGIQKLFLLCEGIAEYIGYNKLVATPSGLKENIEEYLFLTYYVYWDDELLSHLYMLSAEFVHYWCETYGMDNFFKLYRESRLSNFREKIEKYGNTSFDEIINDFINF
jgi:hypothetical protein